MRRHTVFAHDARDSVAAMRRKLLRGVGVLLGLLVVLAAGAWLVWHHPMPATHPGDADALARRMTTAVNADAWARTGAVRWTFFDGAHHLWDRGRNLERYEKGDLRVWLDLTSRQGVAFRGATRLTGEARAKALETVWARWINDSFWLNPVVKCFDDGVSRALVRDDAGRDGVLLSYRSGGVTPGDRYLWLLDANDRPRAWRMWVSVIPIGGLEATWEGWTQLPTGAWVSTLHHMGPATMRLKDVAGAETLSALVPGEDPFAPLFAR